MFKDREDLTVSDYYTTDELNNLKLLKTEDDVLILHINADSLVLNLEKLRNTISELSSNPSIIFVSETMLHESKLEWQLPQVVLQGFELIYHNSTTRKGGVAMYSGETTRKFCV